MALTYSITGGADAAKFNINATSGALTFKTAPDFEQPGDADANNIYVVEVGVSDGTATTKQIINVTVSNVADENLPPQFTSPAAYTVPENQTTVATLTATDPDAGTPPVIPPEPPTGDWPNATSTGAKGTLTVHNGQLEVWGANQIIQNLDVKGSIWVRTSGAKIKNCKAKNVLVGMSNYGEVCTDTIIEDCTFAGDGTKGQTAIVFGNKSSRSRATRCDISGVEDGFMLDPLARDCVLEHSWLHNLASPGAGDPHYDGAQMWHESAKVTIHHNNFDFGPPHSPPSSCFTSSALKDSTLSNNRFRGGAYQVRLDAPVNASNVVTGNDFDEWHFGACTYPQGAVWTNNAFDGKPPVDGPPPAAMTAEKKDNPPKREFKLESDSKAKR